MVILPSCIQENQAHFSQLQMPYLKLCHIHMHAHTHTHAQAEARPTTINSIAVDDYYGNLMPLIKLRVSFARNLRFAALAN